MEKWFGNKLKAWYRTNKRDLPWRQVSDPYKIWLSEIILQQTQVNQGLNYYLNFCEVFPTVKDLAKASEDQVLKLWQGLGYYSRARNLHESAKTIQKRYKGKFPKNYDEIRSLKGIGDYTAAAISSFAFQLPYAVVDGNVYRVLSRVFGIQLPIDSSQGKKVFQDLANNLLDKSHPGEYNQAIMEFGSQYCKPKQPICQVCIFADKCFAHASNQVDRLPKKSKIIKVSLRFLNYLVIVDKANNILINKRIEKDIWKGLYEFILIESNQEQNFSAVMKHPGTRALALKNPKLIHQSKLYRHILTHQKISAKFYLLRVNNIFSKKDGAVSLKSLDYYAFPRLLEKFFEDCDLKELL